LGVQFPQAVPIFKTSLMHSSLPQSFQSDLIDITKNTLTAIQSDFIKSLSPFNLQVYTACQKIPYTPKDWYRDYHDLVVVSAMQQIVNEENKYKNEYPLPDWLVTAAILHDRGYAILASQTNQNADTYLNKKGAHWEGTDTRLLHSKLSRDFAEILLFERSSDNLLSQYKLPKIESIENCPISEQDRESFLSVIEMHDHALIGRYTEMSELARHHFDADSLFSISLVSFVKDYLAYSQDPLKIERARSIGIDKQGKFALESLLALRLARYYSELEQLPLGWDSEIFPLNKRALNLSEASQYIAPHSNTALELTDAAFLLLAECCQKYSQASDLKQFSNWLEDAIAKERS
jgi:hypothetical protein